MPGYFISWRHGTFSKPVLKGFRYAYKDFQIESRRSPLIDNQWQAIP